LPVERFDDHAAQVLPQMLGVAVHVAHAVLEIGGEHLFWRYGCIDQLQVGAQQFGLSRKLWRGQEQEAVFGDELAIYVRQARVTCVQRQRGKQGSGAALYGS
jgi:hypothetical protein